MPASTPSCSQFLRAVRQTIAAHGMFHPHDSVLVGVSGGPDSVALLHVLVEMSSDIPFSISIAHLNHGLRQKESDDDADFVAVLAGNLGVPLHTRRADIAACRHRHRMSIEEAGRCVRYDFFMDLAREYGFTKIALGHHSDDNAESVLMHVIRGTGPLGLSGIPPMRDGLIVRPLIDRTRSQILDFLSKKNLPYVFDTSNSDIRFLRNKIRRELLPYLKNHYNPKMGPALHRLASIAAAEENWMEGLIDPVFKATVITETPGHLTLSVPALADNHPAAQRRMIRKAIRHIKGDLKRLLLFHIDAVIRLLDAEPAFGRLDLPEGVHVYRNGPLLHLQRSSDAGRAVGRLPGRSQDKQKTAYFEYSITGPGSVYVREIGARVRVTEIPAAHLPDLRNAGHRTAFFDMNDVCFPLQLRSIRPGDRFSPLGMRGTQKLKNFFINTKMPREQRPAQSVLLSRNKIIWVVGLRIDDSVKITPSTQRVMKAELIID